MSDRDSPSQKVETELFRSANDEPVFSEPWQARIFGIVVHLCEAQGIPWTEWATRFSEQLASAEKKGDSPDAYYECWLEAAEDWLSEKGLVDPAIRDQVKAEMLSEQLSERGHDPE